MTLAPSKFAYQAKAFKVAREMDTGARFATRGTLQICGTRTTCSCSGVWFYSPSLIRACPPNSVRSRRHDADKVFGYRFCRCWCCLLALARCHNWVVVPCPDRERQGKRNNRRTILRWSRHSLVYPTIERQNALSIPLIAIRVRQLVVVAA